MPGEGPKVVVTFYSNFRYRETDISEVDQTFASAAVDDLVYDVTQNMMELIEEEHEPEEVFVPNYEVKETRHYTEELPGVLPGNTKVIKVIATEGTWRIKINWAEYMRIETETGPVPREPTYSAPIPANFTAADVIAAFAGALTQPMENTSSSLTEPSQPVSLFVETEVFHNNTPPLPPGFSFEHMMNMEGRPGAFIRCEDIGPQEVRFFLFAGFTAFQCEARAESIDLAGVIEKEALSDRKEYELPLEEGPCGETVVETPQGAIQIENPCSGRKAVFRPVSGHRS